MTNLIRSNFQAHPFHLVSPSPWPLFTCVALLTLTTGGVLTMHGFSHAGYLLTLGLISVISSMAFWFRDVISEGYYFIVGVTYFIVYWAQLIGFALFHSLLSTTDVVGGGLTFPQPPALFILLFISTS